MRALYTTCPMGTTEWRVYIVDADDPALKVGGDACYAITDPDTCTILLSAEIKPARRPKFLVHELIHAAIDASGLAITQRWNDAREEVIVRQLSDHLAHALVGGGLWKGRRVPR